MAEMNPFGNSKHLVSLTVTLDGHTTINTVPVHCNNRPSVTMLSTYELVNELKRRTDLELAAAQEEDEDYDEE